MQACSSVDFQKKLRKDTCQDLHESTPPRVDFRGCPCVRFHLTGRGLAAVVDFPAMTVLSVMQFIPPIGACFGGVFEKPCQLEVRRACRRCNSTAGTMHERRYETLPEAVQLDIDAYASWMCQKVMLYDMFQEEQPSLHCTLEANFYVPVFPLSIEIASSRVSISQ